MNTKKLYEGKNLAILTGGGDTPALNATIEAIKCKAAVIGYNVFGIRKGWKGLLGEGDVVNLSNQPYDGWYGGSALRTGRTNPFPTDKNPQDRSNQVIENIKKYNIDILVAIGGDDTLSAAKKLYEKYNVPVIGFPSTIDNDLSTHTTHNYNGEHIGVNICPGFPSAAKGIAEFTNRLCTTAESHSRIIVVEVMGRDAGWLTGAALLGGADISLIPEVPITKERKELFFDKVKEIYGRSKKQYLVVAVSEGTQWYNDEIGEVEHVYAGSDRDEYGHARFGGISNIVAGEIEKRTGIQARAQVSGYYARSGECRKYDKRLVNILADKVLDMLIRQEYGKIPSIELMSSYQEIEEYNTGTVSLSDIKNVKLPEDYYNVEDFHFNERYYDFLSYFVGKPKRFYFDYNFPKIQPE